MACLFGSNKALSTSSFILPFNSKNYIITDTYGDRIDPIDNTTSYHSGIDVVPKDTDVIISIADGTVIESAYDDSRGEHVIIEHQISGHIYRSLYYHLKTDTITVNVGDSVTQGQAIGIMGATGRVTGPHLHFSFQNFNVEKQKFEYTDPSFIIPDDPSTATNKEDEFHNPNLNQDTIPDVFKE